MATFSDDVSREAQQTMSRLAVENVYLAFHEDAARLLAPELDALGRVIPTRADALLALSQTALPRLLKHRMLIDAVRANPIETTEVTGAAREVLRSTLVDTPEIDRERNVDEALRHLLGMQQVPRIHRRILQSDWDDWVKRTDGLFSFKVHERTMSTGCDDSDRGPKMAIDGTVVDSRLITAQFWSEQPPSAFADYVNPVNWPRCSIFWKAMNPVGTPVSDGTPAGYDGVFEEQVDIVTETLTVYLDIGFRMPANGSRVWTRFNMARRDPPFPAAKVDIDTGTVSATLTPNGPALTPNGQAQTLVRATKYLHWADPGRPDLTGFVCELGWAELMVEMANRCGDEPVEAAATAAPAPSVDEAIKRLVDDVTADCRAGIGGYAPHARNLIGRFTGSSWDSRWVNDLLGMGGVAVGTYGNLLGHVRRFADTLSQLDQQTGERS